MMKLMIRERERRNIQIRDTGFVISEKDQEDG